ncbi:carboxypeptidase-like regulatory domain-containing protein [Saccharomonospora sp. NPDC006951]
MRFRHPATLGAAGFLAAAITVVTASPATAAEPEYAEWQLDGTSGTMTLPAAGFPIAEWETDSGGPQIQSGATTFLGADTPFGAEFGGSQGQEYAFIRPAPANQPSTTTFTFPGATPASGWGFATGDIDADKIEISGTDAAGNPVSAAELGFQGAFNYCRNVPKPGSCTADPGDDLPTYSETGDTAVLTGNGSDTSGASGWFTPTVPLSSLTFEFSVLQGAPVYQLWFATDTRTVAGQLNGGCEGSAAEGTVALLDGEGTPIVGADGTPVVTEAEADGSYAFPSIAPGDYEVRVTPAAGLEVDGTNPVNADATNDDVDGADFTLRCEAAPPTTTSPPEPTTDPATTQPPSTSTSTAQAVAVPPQDTGTTPLAATGVRTGPMIGAAVLLLLAGTAMLVAVKRRGKRATGG